MPSIKINTLTEYYYVGSTFTGSTTTPDLYMIGGVVSPTLYPVTFTETGMPTAAGGGVSFNGGPTTAFTTGGTVVFNAADGTYNFVITPGTGYALVSPSPGTTVTVSGGPASVNVVFHAHYTVTFSETGLLLGASWSATLNGTTLPSTGTTITFSQSNGTNLPWSVFSTGYSASPASGTVTVSGGSPSTISITFTSTGVRTTIYAETNATSILTYANPQIEQFTVGTGVGTVPVNFVTLYLSGTGTVSFSIGTQKFASNELANTSVRVAGPGW